MCWKRWLGIRNGWRSFFVYLPTLAPWLVTHCCGRPCSKPSNYPMLLETAINALSRKKGCFVGQYLLFGVGIRYLQSCMNRRQSCEALGFLDHRWVRGIDVVDTAPCSFLGRRVQNIREFSQEIVVCHQLLLEQIDSIDRWETVGNTESPGEHAAKC